MMPEQFMDEWANLQHGQCKHFNVRADLPGVESTCKRLDHKHIKFAVPWFKSYDCGQFACHICKEFEPRDNCKWLQEHWDGKFIDCYAPEGIVWLVLDGNTGVRYGVRAEDFFEGTFKNEDGSIKWVRKQYYKRSRKSPIGYELVMEEKEDGNERVLRNMQV